MASSSETSIVKGLLEKLGYWVEKVETWNHFAGKRKDFFGFGDLFAFHPSQREEIIVQVTAGSGNDGARWRKIVANAAARDWVSVEGRSIVIVSLAARKKRRAGFPLRMMRIDSADFRCRRRPKSVFVDV